METYLLSIFVTLEQEIALRQLFINKGWDFKKCEDANFSEYSEVKEEASNSTCQDLYTPEAVRPEWTAQACTDSCTDINEDVFECDEEKTPILTFQTNVEPSSNTGYTSGGSPGSNATEAIENDVFTKLVEIMEDSLRNMPDGVLVKEEKSVAKDETKDLLNKIPVDGKISTDTEVVQCNDDLGSSLLNYPVVEDKSQPLNKSNCKRRIPENINPSKKSKMIDKNRGALCFGSTSKRKSKLSNLKKSKRKEEIVSSSIKRFSDVEINDTTENVDSKRKGLFHCVDCNYTFKLLGAYEKHKKDGKCIFECEYCGKRFTARYFSNYKAHLRCHIKDRLYQCSLCEKSYINAQALKIHMRKHTGEKPFVCDICGKSFYSSSHLLCHKKTNHLKVKDIFKCDLCSAVLSTMGNLRVHQKVVHTSERPFTCEICGKTFKTQKSLEQVHAKVHQNTYPYKCQITNCEKVFKRVEGLTDHMRRHNNQRSHFCEQCGKGFYCNKDLQLHSRTHSGLKPYSCHMCEYKCALAGNLRKHIKTHQ